MASTPVKGAIRQVKPLLSSDNVEARRRVLKLYRTWYRQLAPIIVTYKLQIPIKTARQHLRNEFMKHKNITDVRTIDMLVIKGNMYFKEVMLKFTQPCHVMYSFKDTALPRPSGFMSKFLSGLD